MKELAGKFCRRCNSTNIAIAANGQVIVVRCLDCTSESKFCPNPGCSGRMLDTSRSGYKEQKCAACGYETNYRNTPPVTQLQLFKQAG